MKKIIIEKAGSYEQLKVREFPSIKPASDEVLIATKACGINFADCCVRMGVYTSAKKYVGWPITPGFEVAGVVEEVGDEVTAFSPGQKVIAITRFGGYTTHLAVPQNQVFTLPETLSFEEGAAIPAIFLTAYYALFELAHPRPNSHLLVHSAAGGVGSSLVQLGKIAQCQVTGVVGSTNKIESVQSLGADTVIDKSARDIWEKGVTYDVILDANGPETLWQSYQHLSSGGKLVVYGFHTMLSKGRGTPNWLKVIWAYLKTPRFNPLHMTGDNHSVLAFNLSYLFEQNALLREGLNQILQWFQEGKLVPPKITSYPIEEVADAHRALESGKTIGKLVLASGE